MKTHVLPVPDRPEIIDRTGACIGVDPNLFYIAREVSGRSADGKTALHVCHHHCPAKTRQACHEWAQECLRRGYHWQGFVIGGVRYVSSGTSKKSGPAERNYQPSRAGCPICVEEGP